MNILAFLINYKFYKIKIQINISNENLASKLKHALTIKYTTDFEKNALKECKIIYLQFLY